MKSKVIFLIVVLLVLASVRSAAQSSYRTIAVNDGGTITGSVKWTGPVPKIPTILINKDPEICDPQAQKKRDLERLIIASNGGVANTVVFLKDITKGKAMDLPEGRQFLNQRTCRYEPHVLLVPDNGTLQIKSSDPVLHTVHMSGSADYNLPFPFANQTVSRTMNREGTVDLRCNAGHVWMNAEMLVVPHPYYAVTDEDGNFKLTDVPPGEYEIVAWHEGWTIVREEAVMDVDAHREVHRPIFSDPKTWEKHVSVPADGTATVNFEISEKSGS
jgi:hypothetical protein